MVRGSLRWFDSKKKRKEKKKDGEKVKKGGKSVCVILREANQKGSHQQKMKIKGGKMELFLKNWKS